MSDDNQVQIPAAFVALFVPPGRLKPSASRDEIATRHELCEDMAGMLCETAQAQRFALGITEADVLERIHRGLVAADSAFTQAEAGWVLHRLAELLDWPQPVLPGELPPAAR